MKSTQENRLRKFGPLVLSSTVLFAIVALLRASASVAPFAHCTTIQLADSRASFVNPSGDDERVELLDYLPSSIESFFLDHAIELGLSLKSPNVSGCTEWKNESSPIAPDLKAFVAALQIYNDKMSTFPGTVKDLREHITTNHSICDTLNLHPSGLEGIFQRGILTQTKHGLIEPIFPPMRDPAFCDGEHHIMSMKYLVHDFPTYCRRLKKTSRVVLVDMGASLDFHGSEESPAIYLTQVYQRFGFHFDHIYAFEIAQKDTNEVFQRLPSELFPAYHWINVGVSDDPNSSRNPWNLILETFNEDDLVVVKLDVDHGVIENALVHQLVESPKLAKLVDAFYFEHHVHLKELVPWWGSGFPWSLYESIKLFTDLRRMGIAAHSWV